MPEELRGEPPTFSLNDGGLFYRLMQQLHLIKPSGLIRFWWLVLVAWGPIAIVDGGRALAGLSPDPTVFDVSLHARLLVALPVMLCAERLVESSSRSGLRSFYNGRFCDPRPLDRIIGRAERLRDSWWPEAVLLGAAVVGGQLALWHVTGATGLFHGGAASGWSFSRVWYGGFALPLVQFVMFRWLWRWSIRSWMLARFARLPLVLIPTHPDHAGGLSCVARPLSAFGGFAFGVSSVLAGAWGTELLQNRTHLRAHLPDLMWFLAIITAVALGPLLPFCGHLYRARRRGFAEYGDFANEYTRRFHAKWITHRSESEGSPLGTPDLQSLNDLGGSYAIVEKVRLFAFGYRSVLAVWCAACLPMLALFADTLTAEHVLRRVASAVLGGFPV